MAQRDYSQLRSYLDDPDVRRRIERAVEVYQKSEKHIDAANRDFESGKLNYEQHERTVTGLAADRDFVFEFLQKEKGGLEALHTADKESDAEKLRALQLQKTKEAQHEKQPETLKQVASRQEIEFEKVLPQKERSIPETAPKQSKTEHAVAMRTAEYEKETPQAGGGFEELKAKRRAQNKKRAEEAAKDQERKFLEKTKMTELEREAAKEAERQRLIELADEKRRQMEQDRQQEHEREL